jgi:hypothetical protein
MDRDALGKSYQPSKEFETGDGAWKGMHVAHAWKSTLV